MLNILIVCDHKSSLDSLVRTLAAEPFFNITGVCADTHAAITVTLREQPDIVFMDGSTDPLAAIEATKKIISCSTAAVIALSRHADTQFASHMLLAGALGYLTSQSSCIEVITAVEEVAKDNVYCCLDIKQFPIPTPLHHSSFKESMRSLRDNTRKKINAVVNVHWHTILQFTN
jgi:DNA-binding NarL/FixJ family response regulator